MPTRLDLWICRKNLYDGARRRCDNGTAYALGFIPHAARQRFHPASGGHVFSEARALQIAICVSSYRSLAFATGIADSAKVQVK